MVQKIGDTPNPTRTTDSTIDNKRDNQKQEWQRRQQMRFERLRGQDGVAPSAGTNALQSVLGHAATQLIGAQPAAAPVAPREVGASVEQTSSVKAAVAEHILPLAELLVAAPPKDVTAAKRFAFDSPPQAQPQPRLTLPSRVLPKVLAFSAVVSDKEANVISRALVRVVERSLGNVAEGLASSASQQLLQHAQVVARALAPITGQIREFNKQGKFAPQKSVDPDAAVIDASTDAEAAAEGEATAQTGAGQQAPGQPGAPTPIAAKAGIKEAPAKVHPIPGLEVRMAKSDVSALAGMLAGDGVDVDTLVELVLSEINRDQEGELKETMLKMQKSNEAKSAQRKLQQKYRTSSLRLEGEQRNEFNMLKAQGAIGKGHTFEEYKDWRKVVVGEPKFDNNGNLVVGADGNPVMSDPCLPEPSPPTNLPPFLSEAVKTDADVSTGSKNAENDHSSEGDAAYFGLTKEQEKILADYYDNYMTPTERADWETKGGLRNWAQGLGLVQAGSLDDVAANNTALAGWIDGLKSSDTQGLEEISGDNVSQIHDDAKALDQMRDTLHNMVHGKMKDPAFLTANGLSDPSTEQAVYDALMQGADDFSLGFQKKVGDEQAAETHLEHEVKKLYLSPADVEKVKADLEQMQFGTYGDIKAGGWEYEFTKIPPQIYDALTGDRSKANKSVDGETIKVLTDDQIAKWSTTEASYQQQLGGADLFSFGLDATQTAAVQAMWDALSPGERKKTYGDDIGQFMKSKLGLKTSDDADYDPVANADTLAKDVADGLASANSPAQKQLWSTLQEQLDFGTQGGFPSKDWGLPAAYGSAVEQLWLATPQAERDKLGNDFGKFVASLGLKQGGTAEENEGIIRQRMETLQSSGLPPADVARLNAAEGALDLDAHPVDYGAFGLSSQIGQFLQALWSTALTPEARAQYGGDVNRWLEEACHLDKDPAKGAENTDTLDTAVKLLLGDTKDVTPIAAPISAPGPNQPPLGQNKIQGVIGNASEAAGNAKGSNPSNAQPVNVNNPIVDQMLADKAAKAQQGALLSMWTQAKSGKLPSDPSGGNNAYVQELIRLGIITEPVKPNKKLVSSSHNDPSTGDNLLTGEKAQNIPLESDGNMMSLAELDAKQQEAKDKLDSLSEAGEMVMLDIQLKNDRHTRTQELLSNIMKKISNTTENIVGNFK